MTATSIDTTDVPNSSTLVEGWVSTEIEASRLTEIFIKISSFTLVAIVVCFLLVLMCIYFSTIKNRKGAHNHSLQVCTIYFCLIVFLLIHFSFRLMFLRWRMVIKMKALLRIQVYTSLMGLGMISYLQVMKML